MTTVLDREMYTEASAARLLRLPPATLHYWLEGRSRGSKTYKPVIREEPTGSNRVTWAEFVEAGLLRQYRRAHNVPMIELRAFIESLRDRLGVSYPLAHARPFVSGQKLVVEAQAAAKLDADFALVAEVGGQYILTTPATEFFERVTWDGDIAARWRPASDTDSPVIVDPDVRFGAPSVGGISTAILREQDMAGEDEQDLADTFGLTVADVRWALAYEMATEAASDRQSRRLFASTSTRTSLALQSWYAKSAPTSPTPVIQARGSRSDFDHHVRSSIPQPGTPSGFPRWRLAAG